MNDMCCCTKNQALLTTEEAALYLGVPVNYTYCARSRNCQVASFTAPKFVRLRAEKKGRKWIAYLDRARQMAYLAPLREKKRR